MRSNSWILTAAVILLCSSVALGCTFSELIWTPEKSADALYRFVRDGKIGYIDGKGKVVIKPTYETDQIFGDFHDGRLNVLEHKGDQSRDYYIDAKGRKVFDATAFFYAGSFSEGLATVIASADAGRGLEGYIDVSGNLVIPPRFDHANPFSDGVAQVEINERWGYINKDGTFAISARFLRARSFNEGRAWVIIEGPCQMDYPICGEKLALPPSTVTGIHSLAFQTPAAIERLRALPVCKYALIDKSGTIMTSLRFVESQDFSEGLAAVTVGKLWGYVNRDGTMAIPPTLVVAGNFSEGLAAAIRSDQPSDSGFGFIDRSGSFVIKPQFQGAQPFSEGLAVVSDGKRYWYIDHEGRNPFSKTFEAAGSFFKGLAHVKTAPGKPDRASNGTFAYINRSGKAVFTYQNQEKD